MRNIILVTAVVLYGVSAPAYGKEQADPKRDEEATWSIGAGIGGYSSYYVYYMGNNYSALPETPSSVIFVERRVSPRWWVVAGLEGTYSHTGNQDAIIAGAMPKVTSHSMMGTAGVRYVFNPGGAVELSLYGAASLYYLTIDGEDSSAADPDDTRSTHNGYKGAIGSVGLAVERKLMKNLYLRLSTTLASIRYSTSTYEETSVSGATAGHTFSIWDGGINFKPSLQLRLTF